jgi:O-antigen/teichoic acid export membrane protein
MIAVSSATEKSLIRMSLMRFWPSERENARELIQTAWIVGDQAVVSLANFLSTVIVGRMCGQEELGIYVLATTMFWLVAGIPNALTWTPFTSRAPRMSPDRRAAYTGSITIHTVVLTLILTAIFGTAGIVPAAWFGQPKWLSMMCLALVPFTAMMTLREHVRRLCLSQVATREILLLDFPIAVAQLVLLLWLARSGQLSANTGLLAIAAACLLSIVWFIARGSEFQFSRRRAAIHWSYNLQFGRWLLAVSIAWLLTDSMYRWIVGLQYGLDGLGRFASAQAVVLFINPLLLTATNFGRALSANRLASGGIRALRRFTLQATLLVTIVGGLAFLALAIVGGPLVHLIFGEKYVGLGGIVATLCLGMLVRVAGVPIDASLAAMREGRTMFIAIFVQLAVVVVAGVPLIAHCGLNGVGYTMALAYGAAAAIEWRRFLQCEPSTADREEAQAPALGFN